MDIAGRRYRLFGPLARDQVGFRRRRLRAQGLALTANVKGERVIRQRRFWEHQTRDEIDLARHVAYAHINPVKHGRVERAADLRWSTFHRYVRLGILPADRATEVSVKGAFGE